MIPKFRAWDKSNKKMCDVKALSAFNGGEVTIKRDGENASYVVPIERVILMQSTGLFDENGEETFEGDIVMTTRFKIRADEIGGCYEYEKDYKGIVKLLEGSWVIDTGKDAVNLWTEIEENIVIGNSYENPDLLESVEE